LRRVRLAAGFSQAELSRTSGVYRNHISKMELGLNSAATHSRLGFNASAVKLARALNTTPAAIWPMYAELFAAAKHAAAARRQAAVDRESVARGRRKRLDEKRKKIGKVEKLHRQRLSANQRNAARLYADGKTLSQIARMNGITKQAVFATLCAILRREE